MSRCVELIASAREAFNQPTPAAIYQWIQHLDDEYSRHRYPELLLHHLTADDPQDSAFSVACLSAVHALKLALSLRLHTHFRRVMAAACVTRSLHDQLDWWQQKGLTQASWCAAFGLQKPLRDSFYFSEWCLQVARFQLAPESYNSEIQKLLAGPQRSRYWFFAEQIRTPIDWTTGCLLHHKSSEKQGYLLRSQHDHALLLHSDLSTTEKVELSDFRCWQLSTSEAPTQHALQQLEYHRSLNQQLPGISFKAPKALLTAVKRYTAGSGALAPVIRHIRQQPLLANSLRQAARQQMIAANDPQRMELKHIYLWLGGTRASATLATASLQQQFMQQRVPLQQSLMQRLSLLTELLQSLSTETGSRLPVPASLLTLLTAADLFRNQRVLRASHWPQLDVLRHADKAGWVATHEPQNDQRLSRQLIRRWQLERQLAPLLAPEQHQNHPLPALMTLANIAVVLAFQPDIKLSKDVHQQLQSCLKHLRLKPAVYTKLRQKSIYRCRSFSPLSELFNLQDE